MDTVKPKVYLETSIISYLTARLSRDLITAANQQITQKWWENESANYTLFVSELVVLEASAGDAQMVQKRLEALQTTTLIKPSEEAEILTENIIQRKLLPEKASADAAHIAIATVHGVDFLLTWNFKHIANARIFPKVFEVCVSNGYKPPVICTPSELLGEGYEG